MDGYLSSEDFHCVRRIIGSASGDIQLLEVVSVLQVAAAIQLGAALVSLLSVMVVPITLVAFGVPLLKRKSENRFKTVVKRGVRVLRVMPGGFDQKQENNISADNRQGDRTRPAVPKAWWRISHSIILLISARAYVCRSPVRSHFGSRFWPEHSFVALGSLLAP